MLNSPLVIVPVLSNATALISPSDSRTSPPLMKIPILAARSIAQKDATGVDSTNAQGHALTSITRASFHHCSRPSAPSRAGIRATPAATTTTPGV
ncbi:Os07g0233000 [Oryza sativa Japonica Group]|uniref:Os07g0233000 protein n=1 Tax=Oryza sativa subsp. japonica TaxID=39947 RepID=A0A0P0X3Y8_ORYSJ|nr:hypothetical protein EE612_038057 [Oryza sativa]BAT00726.1 Os07g0233000 [Oryza sativa Japonica Group]